MRMTLHGEWIRGNERIIGTINIGVFISIRDRCNRRRRVWFDRLFLLLTLVTNLCLNLLVLNGCLHESVFRFHVIASAPLRKAVLP